MAAYALASLLCALAPSVPVLIVCRLIQGLGGAAGVVIARAVVRDVYTGSAVARFLALTMLISGLAPILGPVACHLVRLHVAILGRYLAPWSSWFTGQNVSSA